MKMTIIFTTVITSKRHYILKTTFLTLHSIKLSSTSIFVVLNLINTNGVTLYH
jgi:hypothetical protein